MPTDNLSETTGKPILSVFTIITIPIPAGNGMCAQIPIPSIWPISPVGPTEKTIVTGEYGYPLYNTVGSLRPPLVPCGTPEGGWPNEIEAGGSMHTEGVMDFFRMFYTPTTTGGQGLSMCFNTIPTITGNVPPPTVSPFVPEGNCVYIAKQLSTCQDMGQLSDLGALASNGFTNASGLQSIGQQVPQMPQSAVQGVQSSITSYLQGNVSGQLAPLKGVISQYGSSLPGLGQAGGMLGGVGGGMGGLLGGAGGGMGGISLSLDDLSNLNLDDIQKVVQQRVASFPDFIMSWTDKEEQEVVNKLSSLPTMVTVLPDPQTIVNNGWTNFGEKLHQAAQTAGDTSHQNLSGVRTAFDFAANVPLVHMKAEQSAVDVPWIAPEDASRWLADAESAQSSGSGSDALSQNIQHMQQAQQFPQQLDETLSYKEKYADQLLCNVNSVQTNQSSWIADNSSHLKSWIEEDTTVSSALDTWQKIPDIFFEYSEQFEVSRNERNDLKQYMFKIISAVLPQVPVIQFPRQPDV